MALTQLADVAARSAPPAAITEASSSPASPAPVAKKRRVERRERLRKSALCKHFDKPGGCPFPNCKFAHGRAEVNDSDTHSVAAQRRLIREQAIHRAEEQFQTADAGAVTSKRRGTMASCWLLKILLDWRLIGAVQIERYYTEMFSCDTMGKPMEDQYVHMHSNRLCVVGVAESHPVMLEELVSVEFTQNVLESRVTGKKKKGGRFMLPNTVLCVLKCKSGREFNLYSCIRGALIEVNERLQKEPELLKQKVSELSTDYVTLTNGSSFFAGHCCSCSTNRTDTLSSFNLRRWRWRRSRSHCCRRKSTSSSEPFRRLIRHRMHRHRSLLSQP
ncbi:hypothetical protein, variant 2 [Phytophthora nicotianae]|uniref:C3H1-type domain-containing protein n=1 Tax=Phytophthora nicotianae TaxID=4792 RepID=W2L1M9_PHYNI|nr:hypothetical protein, variant 2 [Phytophthora nicotianae]